MPREVILIFFLFIEIDDAHKMRRAPKLFFFNYPDCNKFIQDDYFYFKTLNGVWNVYDFFFEYISILVSLPRIQMNDQTSFRIDLKVIYIKFVNLSKG